MARLTRCRKICMEPAYGRFRPEVLRCKHPASDFEKVIRKTEVKSGMQSSAELFRST